MHPYMDFFGHTVPAYSAVTLAGFLIGILCIAMVCKRRRLRTEDGIYIYAFSMIGAMIGAKLLYLLIVLPRLTPLLSMSGKELHIAAKELLEGGMVFYGGLFGAAAAAFHTAKQYGNDLKAYYPALLPVMAIVAGCGRIGCLMAGCCYGKETAVGPHVVFHVSRFAPNGVALIPVQLYEALFDFGLAVLMLLMGRSDRWREDAFRIYLLTYSAFRFIIEFFRGDEERGVWEGVSVSQWIAMACIIGLLWYERNKSNEVRIRKEG